MTPLCQDINQTFSRQVFFVLKIAQQIGKLDVALIRLHTTLANGDISFSEAHSRLSDRWCVSNGSGAILDRLRVVKIHAIRYFVLYSIPKLLEFLALQDGLARSERVFFEHCSQCVQHFTPSI